jgi:hypothetical protein
MKTLSKAALIATTGAMLMTAMPANAKPDRRDHKGISAGDVLVGALILGGIAAVASSSPRNWDDDQNSYGYNGYDNNGYESRRAVDQCVRAALREASRYGGWARVTDVMRVDRIRGGYEVRGRVVVKDDYGRDKGPFSCVTRYGGVSNVDLYGLRSRY